MSRLTALQAVAGVACAFYMGFAPGWVLAAPLQFTLQGTAQVAFTPGEAADQLIIDAIRQARRQVLVQAYGFTHKGIAEALIAAHGRGIDVQVLADPNQARQLVNSQIDELASAGVLVWLDADHAAAHNKVMIIDVGGRDAVLITGSFNFTTAAQHRNAENILLLRGNANLAEAYAANWRRHKFHSLPVRP